MDDRDPSRLPIALDQDSLGERSDQIFFEQIDAIKGGMREKLRKLFADSIAMVTFSTASGMAIEIFVAGLSLEQSLQVRLSAVIPNLLTARLYGMYRDWVMEKMRTNETGVIRQIIADTAAFVSFQVPLYTGILLYTGADMEQIIIACGGLSIVSAFQGRPYGIFLDFTRKLLGADSDEQVPE